jgi:hypothetical protein
LESSAVRVAHRATAYRSLAWDSDDCNGRTIWIADVHRGDGKRFVVRADDKLTAFLELEAAIQRNGRPFPSLVSYARFQTAARFSLCFTREEKQSAF